MQIFVLTPSSHTPSVPRRNKLFLTVIPLNLDLVIIACSPWLGISIAPLSQSSFPTLLNDKNPTPKYINLYSVLLKTINLHNFTYIVFYIKYIKFMLNLCLTCDNYINGVYFVLFFWISLCLLSFRFCCSIFFCDGTGWERLWWIKTSMFFHVNLYGTPLVWRVI